MDLNIYDVLIYAIGEVNSDRSGVLFSDEQVAEAMNISVETLYINISRLVTRGYAVRDRNQPRGSKIRRTELTEDGKERLSCVRRAMGALVLSPEKHGVASYQKMEEIISRTKNPLERIFLLQMYVKKRHFDLEQFILNLYTTRNEMNVLNYLKRLDGEDRSGDIPYNVQIFRMTLYGDKTAFEATLSENMSPEKIDTVLVHAESLYRQGKLERAKTIYEHLLSDQPNITRNQWFQANLGLVQVVRRMDGPPKAIEFLEELSKVTQDKLFQNMILQVKGTCYGIKGDYESAIRYISAAIRSFRYHNHPLLLAIALNNRGVMFFSKDEVDLANKDWTRAMIAARKANSRFVEGRLLINLADVWIKKGDLGKAKRLMDRSERLFTAVKDLEGMSGLEFNRALLCIAKGDTNGFKGHFSLSETIAYPLPSKVEREFRRKVMLERANESGNEEIAAFLKGSE